jgi:ubiquinone/menaquinone biosynthesis C-methylase UbiE
MREQWAAGRNATNAYRKRLRELVKPGMRILHAGCGWDKNEISREFKDVCTVIGVDMDDRVKTMFHSEFRLASLEALPFPADSFDVIFSEYVFEHLRDPEQVLLEMKRVVKPSGSILILAPNYFSYKTIAARLTPHRFHLLVGRHRYGGGHDEDMYPTLFRCNTKRQFETLSSRVGLKIRRFRFVTNGPTWFEKIPGLFGLFHFFHSAVRDLDLGSQLRCALIVELRKN